MWALEKMMLLFVLCWTAAVVSGAPVAEDAVVRVERNAEQEGGGSNNSPTFSPYVEILRGRDGRDGRDGPQGIPGEKGEQGDMGPPGLQGESGPAGVVYTRWGRDDCPDTPGTELLYAGITAGSWFNHHGGGSNHLCLPREPQYLLYHNGVQGYSPLYGTEYENTNDLLPSTYNYNVPCAVCYVSSKATVVMIPARTSCLSTNWRMEYVGYLMASHPGHKGRSTFECVDKDAEAIPGSSADTNGARFYLVEATCNGIPCGPYDPQKELTCVVCTK